MICFSDMDGTFLTSRKEISALNLEALDGLAAAGMFFVPCTGRPLRGVLPTLREHPAVRYVVTTNGAAIYELDEHDPSLGAARLLHATLLDRDRALAVWEAVRGLDVTFDIFADGVCYLRRDLIARIPEFVADPFIARSMMDNRIPVDEEPPATLARVHELDRISVYWHDPCDRDAVAEVLHQIEDVEVTSSFTQNFEIMGPGASKGAALAWLCDHLGIPVADAVAFGDHLNDISMIEAAGTGVAVANAEPEVRAAADVVARSNDESGVGRFILERLEAQR